MKKTHIAFIAMICAFCVSCDKDRKELDDFDREDIEETIRREYEEKLKQEYENSLRLEQERIRNQQKLNEINQKIESLSNQLNNTQSQATSQAFGAGWNIAKGKNEDNGLLVLFGLIDAVDSFKKIGTIEDLKREIASLKTEKQQLLYKINNPTSNSQTSNTIQQNTSSNTTKNTNQKTYTKSSQSKSFLDMVEEYL